jgi:tetratricopeptide (TPR) repeat protein
MNRLVLRVRGLLSELKRRKVFRVAGVYAVVAFVVVQVADIVFPALHLPAWTVTLVVSLALLGFPIALVLAWALEVTPDGVKRTQPTAPPPPQATAESSGDSRRLAIGLIAGFCIAVGGLGTYGWITSGGPASGDEASAYDHDVGEAGPAPDTALDPHRVAVLPFAVRGAEELEYLGESMVELLGRSLDGAGPLRTTDPRAVLSRVAHEAFPVLGPEEGREVAESFGAGLYLLGSITRVGEEIRLEAAWYGSEGQQLGSEEVTPRSEAEILTGIDDLARSAVAALLGEEVHHRGVLAEQTTASLEALRAYLDGQAHMRRNDFEAAADAFQRAMDADPDFTLAHYWLSRVAGWTWEWYEPGLQAAQRAVELSENLPHRDRQLIAANLAHMEGRFDEAERLYRFLIDTDPNDVEAWYMLGEAVYHAANIRGSSALLARRYFERAVEMDPTLNEPLYHLMEIAGAERDTELLDRITGDLDRRSLGSWEEEVYPAVRAYLLGDPPHADISQEDPDVIWGATWFLQRWGMFEEVEALIRPFTRPDRSEDTRRGAHTLIASLLLFRGKLESAGMEISAADADPHMQAWMATLPFLPGEVFTREERSSLLERVLAWDPETADHDYAPNLEAERLYLLGLLHATNGDERQALDAAARLRAMEPDGRAPSGQTNLARGIEVEVRRQRGDPEGALDILQAFEFEGGASMYERVYKAERERFLRAELLAAAGRFQEALGWYQTLDGRYVPGEMGLLAPAYLGRGRVLEALDRPEEAAAAYERFLEMWSHADEPLQPKVEEARRRLEYLTGEGGRAINRPQPEDDRPRWGYGFTLP